MLLALTWCYRHLLSITWLAALVLLALKLISDYTFFWTGNSCLENTEIMLLGVHVMNNSFSTKSTCEMMMWALLDGTVTVLPSFTFYIATSGVSVVGFRVDIWIYFFWTSNSCLARKFHLSKLVLFCSSNFSLNFFSFLFSRK